MEKTIIRNGTIVTGNAVFQGDILIEGDKIAAIATQIIDAEAAIVDAAGKYVLPGAVDIHTHMDLDVGIARATDDFYTGTVAAACGGTTTIVDHMAFGPKGCSPWHQVKEYHHLADGNAVIDYGFHGVLQHVNEQVLKDMGEIAAYEGVTSFKAYMTYDNSLKDPELFTVLQYAKETGILITAHCENDEVIRSLREQFVREGKTEARFHPVSRPAGAEAEAVNRFLRLAHEAGDAPVYVVHVSSEAALAEYEKAKMRGQQHIGAETCPQYLLLDDSFYDDPKEGLKAIMSPPLRKSSDQEALWQGLKTGLIDAVATDHCPFTFAKQKQQGATDFTKCPGGAPGVEERLILLYSEGVAKGRISLQQMVRLLCENPAKVGGLYPKKGILAGGSDADIVILDPDQRQMLSIDHMHGAADYTCYEGMQVKGAVSQVWLRGKLLVKDGTFYGKRGDGQYIKRGVSSIV